MTTQSTLPSSFSGLRAFRPSKVIEHGMILQSPVKPVSGTTGRLAYELGCCLQLDADTCLLLASIDEQGGGDLCVGNDAYVFQVLSEIQPDRAVPVNRVDTNYVQADGRRACLAKFPALGGFIPLGATLEDGKDHPAAGTGFLLSGCVAFSPDKASALHTPESFMEMIQIRWDGKNVTFTHPVYIREILGLPVECDNPLTSFSRKGTGFLLPIGVRGQGICTFLYEYRNERWQAVAHGTPFCTRPESESPAPPGEPFTRVPGEIEASLRQVGDRYFIHTRGTDPVGRLYESKDGFNFHLRLARPNHTVPQVMNHAPDGSLYVATNGNQGQWMRNPLLAYDLSGTGLAEGIVLHDHEGARDDAGPTIPFVDHGIGCNVDLEGRSRHLVFFRVCDLKERTLHQFQLDLGIGKLIYGKDGGPIPKRATTGLYLTELEFASTASEA